MFCMTVSFYFPMHGLSEHIYQYLEGSEDHPVNVKDIKVIESIVYNKTINKDIMASLCTVFKSLCT